MVAACPLRPGYEITLPYFKSGMTKALYIGIKISLFKNINALLIISKVWLEFYTAIYMILK